MYIQYLPNVKNTHIYPYTYIPKCRAIMYRAKRTRIFSSQVRFWTSSAAPIPGRLQAKKRNTTSQNM